MGIRLGINKWLKEKFFYQDLNDTFSAITKLPIDDAMMSYIRNFDNIGNEETHTPDPRGIDGNVFKYIRIPKKTSSTPGGFVLETDNIITYKDINNFRSSYDISAIKTIQSTISIGSYEPRGWAYVDGTMSIKDYNVFTLSFNMSEEENKNGACFLYDGTNRVQLLGTSQTGDGGIEQGIVLVMMDLVNNKAILNIYKNTSANESGSSDNTFAGRWNYQSTVDISSLDLTGDYYLSAGRNSDGSEDSGSCSLSASAPIEFSTEVVYEYSTDNGVTWNTDNFLNYLATPTNQIKLRISGTLLADEVVSISPIILPSY